MASKSLVAVLLVLLLFVACLNFSTCNPRKRLGKCNLSDNLRGKSGNCNKAHCVNGEMYPQYDCSPPIIGNTGATMTINSFAKGGDGSGPSECDNQYHSDDELAVASSTGWYNGGSRCLNKIRINANGRSVLAKVVDECASINGCESDHDFQPPCPNNILCNIPILSL